MVNATSNTKPSLDVQCVNTIRTLSMDALEAAKSGHPGAPMGLAAAGYVLWTRVLKHNPLDPAWPDRDRFVFSAGHASAMLYSLLHLWGYDLPLHDFQKGSYDGRNLRFGVREHAMGAILSGMALHKGLRPYGGTFLVFADYMRSAIRLAALMKLPVIYIFTHDSIAVGEDGPTHQPVEHLASLRAIPGLRVIHPADAIETVEAGITMGWERYTGAGGAFVGMTGFGASAPGGVVLEKFGFTPETVVRAALNLLGKPEVEGV